MMASDSSGNRSIAPTVALAIASLVASVGSGLLVFYLTDKTGGLKYSVNTSAVFTGRSRSISIAGVRVSNPDKKEVEEVRVVIPALKSTVADYKVVGLQPNAFSQVVNDKQIELKVPYLNPREAFSIQVLFSPGTPGFAIDGGNVSVRGKGLIATLDSPVTNSRQRELLPLFVAGLMPLLFLALDRVYPSLFYTKRHSGDQRDITAFLLGIHSLHEEALHVRSIQRSCSYWSLSDYVAEACINSRDNAKIANGIKCLTELLEYASFADTSKLIVHYNLSSMAAAIGDEALAKKHLALARNGGHHVIEKRISMDRNLGQLL